ncbi:MAG: N-acetylglucosamine kinase [Hyphomicrobiales bacterium]|nr:N-acetylglucosamine kinase [Hyphomicrobiales bacterium]
MAAGRICFLGVDGGGTGCRARIETEAGEVIGQGLSGPATTRLGIDAAFASIMAAAGAAMAEAGIDPSRVTLHAGIGLAGVGRKGALDALARQPHPFASISFISDALAACFGAHSGEDGAIVIAGTGSIGIGRVGGRDLRIGGYGFPVSDEGSGADLGLEAVRLALRAHDGRLPPTALLTEVMQRFNHDPFEIIGWMDRASATDYATLAPMVMRHADQGDATARRIVQQAAEQIDALVRGLFDEGAPKVALLGGLSSAIEPWLSPDVRRRLRAADGDAVSGALILARRAAPNQSGTA